MCCIATQRSSPLVVLMPRTRGLLHHQEATATSLVPLAERLGQGASPLWTVWTYCHLLHDDCM
jgi:hypothetical protein